MCSPIAHASVGLIAKLNTPKAPLWAMLAATQVPDLLFFVFEAAGIEHQAVSHMDFSQGLTYLSPALIPWSHGLFMCLVWSMVASAIAFLFSRNSRVSMVIGSLVFSHWLLDFIVYNNLPILFRNSPELGLGLITSGPGAVAGILLEIGLFAGGIASYLIARKRTRISIPQTSV